MPAADVLVDGLIRTGGLIALLALVGLWEAAAPCRVLSARRSLRWPTNFTLGPLNALLAAVPLAPVALAIALADHPPGLSMSVSLPRWLTVIAAVLLLDVVLYVQHRAFHAVRVLWAVHRVHHADVDCDYTTAFRFHPIEAMLTNATVLAVIAIVGLPPLAVLVHQSMAAIITIIEHANAAWPAGLEALVRRIFVTPDMHRIHHSRERPSTDSNFGTIFSFWDRWLGTYRQPATTSRDGMDVGLEEFREPKYLTLPWTLALPFLRSRVPGALTTSSSAAPSRSV
jgi:sterol desaturase/sphingolipid hydroxylase (fatty acid hydroxylase superfamily)